MSTPSVLDEGFRNFVATSDVAPQRKAAYQYADLKPKGTRQAMPCPAGGALHQADGGLIPISPWDWVVEQPNGTLISVSAEEIADHWEFADGPDDLREAHAQTVEWVANSRKEPRKNPPIKVVNETPQPHPDSGEAAANYDDARADRNAQAAYERQAREARKHLEQVVQVATKRDLITDDEGKDWLDLGVQPEHVEVRFDQVLGTYQVARVVPADAGPAPGDQNAESEGTAPAEGTKA